MTTEPKPRIKITYATLRADNEELQALYEAGIEKARARLGGRQVGAQAFDGRLQVVAFCGHGRNGSFRRGRALFGCRVTIDAAATATCSSRECQVQTIAVQGN